jgi:hypothetical protein
MGSRLPSSRNAYLGQVVLVSPDDPTYSGIDEAEFVSRSVNGLDTRELKVPLGSSSFSMSEWRNKATRCCIDMDWDIVSSLLLKLVQDLRDFLHWFVMTSVSRAQNHKDTNGVLVDVFAN